MIKKRFIKTTLLSWLLFIGIDFFFHAALIRQLWKESVPAFLTDDQLFKRIPFGYLSFFLFTVFLGYIFREVFNEKPGTKKFIRFAVIVGALFSISNFLALYSFVNIPLKHLVVFNIIYFIESIAVLFAYKAGIFSESFKRFTFFCLLLFFCLVILGIIIQNILS